MLYILSLFFLLALQTGRAEEKSAPEKIRFVQITDTHFGQIVRLKLGDKAILVNNTERTRKVIKAINHLPYKLAFVVHTGDIFNENMTDPAMVKTAKDILNELKVPLLITPGNHDIHWQTGNKDAKIYTDAFGPLLKSQEFGGVIFITVFTGEMAQGTKITGFEPWKELTAALEKAADKPVILFHHTPSTIEFYKNREHAGWRPEIRKQWTELLNKYNVKAVVAGHFHRDEVNWLDKIPQFVAPPVSARFNRQPAYRIYTYENGKLSYTTQYLE